MTPIQIKSLLALWPLLLVGLLASCNQSTTTAEGPHATVLMRDGTQVSGFVTASTPSGITLMGDDKASHTISMAQVKSVFYDQQQAGQPVDSTARRADPMHDDHYQPPVPGIRSDALT